LTAPNSRRNRCLGYELLQHAAFAVLYTTVDNQPDDSDPEEVRPLDIDENDEGNDDESKGRNRNPGWPKRQSGPHPMLQLIDPLDRCSRALDTGFDIRF